MGYLSGLIPAFTMAFRPYSPFACSHSDNNFCLYLLVHSASFSVGCRNELQSSEMQVGWLI